MPSSLSQRTAIEQRIQQRLEALKKGFRQNIGILGPEGLGKTSLLGDLYRCLGRDPEILAAYVDCQALDFSDLAGRWMSSLLACVLPASEMQHDALSSQLAALEAKLPKTVEKMRSLRKMIRRGEKNAAAARELLSLSHVLSEEAGRRLVLILDEFHALSMLPVTDPFALLGRQIMVEKGTLYLAASSKPALASEIFQHQLALLFGNFEVMPMAPLDPAETVQFIEMRLPGVLFSETQKKFIIRMTGGVPLYLDLILQHLRDVPFSAPSGEGMREALAAPLMNENLLAAVENEIFDPHGRLAQIFQRRLERCLGPVKDGAVFYRTLIAISEGLRKVHAIAVYTERKISDCKKTLQRLGQEELVSKRHDFYQIEDGLFAFWMREVFAVQKRHAVPFGDERRNFRLILSRILEQADFEGPDAVLGRIEALLKSFRDDTIQLGNKRMRLPPFAEVSVTPCAGRLYPVLAAAGSGKWEVQTAFDVIHEDDVLLFNEASRKTKKKKQPLRLMIALGGVDQNARLMAQEAQIGIWSLSDLNLLFSLYNLPTLIWMRKLDGSTLGALAKSLHPA